MFDPKCILIILVIIIFRNCFYSCHGQIINEINLYGENNDAYIELAFPPCKSNCSSSGLFLLILEEKPNTTLFIISDVVILYDIVSNENGLFTVGKSNNLNLQHQFKYHSNLLHGLALFQYMDLQQSTNMDQFKTEILDKLLFWNGES